MVEPGRHSLTKGVPVQVSPDARLTLVGVDDSRCPEGVQCIWAGQIVYHFELSSCGRTERFDLKPADAAPGGTLPERPIHTFGLAPTMHISLAPQEPPRRGRTDASPVERVEVILTPN